MGTVKLTTLKSNTAGVPPVIQDSAGVEIGQMCRAWVNFNGTGTVAIRDSFNVSSITDNGTGDYTINLTTAMPTANYAALIVCSADLTGPSFTRAHAIHTTGSITESAPTTTSYRIATANQAGSVIDIKYVTTMVFGD